MRTGNLIRWDGESEDEKFCENDRRMLIHLRTILGAVVDHMLYLDDHMRIIWASRPAAEMAGCSVADMIGRKCYSFFGDGIGPCPDCPCVVALNSGIPERKSLLRNLSVSRDDSLWWDIYGVPIRGCEGAVLGVLEIGRDITEIKREEKVRQLSQERLKLAIESNEDALWDWNIETGEMFTGYKWPGLLGYSDDEFYLDFQGWMERICLADRPAFEKTLREHLCGDRGYFECRHRVRTKSGEWKWVMARGRVVARDDGAKPLRMTGTVTDIHSQKEMEIKLVEARCKAENANRASRDFLASMSHEMRTPMNGIIGVTDLLMETELTAQQREYLDMISISSHNLLKLINDILDLSKAESGRMQLRREPFSLRRLCHQVRSTMMVQMGDKELKLGLTMDEKIPKILLGDELRLRQVLINLVGNAIKFTSRGSIDLSVKVRSNSNDRIELVFSVRDTGVGISDERMKLLFQEYFSPLDGPSDSSSYCGTGLGLPISRRIVEAMNGSIWAESEEGAGSTFSFTVSLEVAGQRKLSNVGDEGQKVHFTAESLPQNLNILLVEDNIINRKLAMAILDRPTWNVECATDGVSAIDLFVKRYFDMIFMDLQMPGMDGFETVAEMRRIERNWGGHVPIVAVTAHAMEKDRRRCLKAGMDGFLSKPFDREALCRIILERTSKYETKRRFDMEDVLVRLNGNRELLNDLVDEFLKTVPLSLASLNKAIAEKDSVMVSREAHRIKGSISCFSTATAFELAGRIQLFGEAEDLEEAGCLLPKFEEALRVMIEELEDFRRDGP